MRHAALFIGHWIALLYASQLVPCDKQKTDADMWTFYLARVLVLEFSTVAAVGLLRCPTCLPRSCHIKKQKNCYTILSSILTILCIFLLPTYFSLSSPSSLSSLLSAYSFFFCVSPDLHCPPPPAFFTFAVAVCSANTFSSGPDRFHPDLLSSFSTVPALSRESHLPNSLPLYFVLFSSLYRTKQQNEENSALLSRCGAENSLGRWLATTENNRGHVDLPPFATEELSAAR
jgi:hypothetical protein